MNRARALLGRRKKEREKEEESLGETSHSYQEKPRSSQSARARYGSLYDVALCFTRVSYFSLVPFLYSVYDSLCRLLCVTVESTFITLLSVCMLLSDCMLLSESSSFCTVLFMSSSLYLYTEYFPYFSVSLSPDRLSLSYSLNRLLSA